MTKIQFLLALSNQLSGLPKEDVEERLTFYSEMIEDRMEEGLSEEEAVAAVGFVEEIAAQIIGEVPLPKLVKEKVTTKRKMRAWEIVLLILGAPIWFSLLIAAFAVALSLYVSLWAVIVVLWGAGFGTLVGCAFGITAAGIIFLCIGREIAGMVLIGAGLVCAGLSIFFFIGCKAATKGVVWLTGKMALAIKKCFMKKEEVSCVNVR